jgi:hypothetical protein
MADGSARRTALDREAQHDCAVCGGSARCALIGLALLFGGRRGSGDPPSPATEADMRLQDGACSHLVAAAYTIALLALVAGALSPHVLVSGADPHFDLYSIIGAGAGLGAAFVLLRWRRR